VHQLSQSLDALTGYRTHDEDLDARGDGLDGRDLLGGVIDEVGLGQEHDGCRAGIEAERKQ
jgi:hypothetical protein